MISRQAEIPATHLLAFLPLQVVDKYVCFIIVTSKLAEHWRLIDKTTKPICCAPNIKEIITSVFVLFILFCFLL